MQAQEYPGNLALRMLALAHRMRDAAARHRYRGAPLILRVGLHCGPVAGAVVGAARAFYCLYGDAVNTAARMCKHAGGGIHASGAFAAAAAAAGPSLVECVSRGVRAIKGKGLMETFDVALIAPLGPDLPAPIPPPTTRPSRAARFAARGLSAHDAAAAGSSSAAVADARCLVGGSGRADTLSAKGSELWVEVEAAASGSGGCLRAIWQAVAGSGGRAERDFQAGQTGAWRRGIAAGLAMHAAAVVLQWQQAVRPEYDYDFAALGAEGLAKGRAAVASILRAHGSATAALCAALLAAMWAGKPQPGAWAAAFAVLKLGHLAASLACYACFPGDGWLVTFPVQILMLHGWMGAIPARYSLALTAAGVALCLAGVEAVRPMPTVAAATNKGMVLAVFAIGAAWLSVAADRDLRRSWQRRRRCSLELRRLRARLRDLLPEEVAARMLQLSAPPPCERRGAVVLQLDICGFTSLSASLPPMEASTHTRHSLPSCLASHDELQPLSL